MNEDETDSKASVVITVLSSDALGALSGAISGAIVGPEGIVASALWEGIAGSAGSAIKNALK